MNTKTLSPDEKISRIFRAISSPARVQILAAIGRREACVCHLETVLDMRQAYISQQLMEMREADLLETRRDGRYIFYRLSEPELLDKIIEIGTLFDISNKEMAGLIQNDPRPDCCCPDCVTQLKPTKKNEQDISTIN
jgi:ArsR family transcriptional regulator